MSEPVTKQRPTVDLDNFEREMRDTQPPHHHDDPLAELARLVGEQSDPYGDVFAREAQVPANAGSRVRGYDEPRHLAEDYSGQSRREPAFEAPRVPLSPRLTGDFAAIEAGLRGGQAGHDPYAHSDDQAYVHAADHGHGYAEPHDHADPHGYGEPTAYDPGWGQPAAAPRSRRPLYLMVATIAVGVIGIGAAFALKGHIGTSPREVKTILADAGPTKVQPPADSAAGDATQDPAMMGRNQPSPTALVSREEQPVDVSQAVQDNAARARRTDAASVPVPPSPGQVQGGAADPATMQNFPLADMPAPKRVRVVSVRPDGTILPGDDPAPAAPPAPSPQVKASDRAGVAAKPSTPKASATKTTSRVTTPKTIDQLAGASDGATPPPPAPKVKKPKPQRVAAVEPTDTDATQAAPPAATSGAGGWAVQLAAPRTEADARAASSKLAKQFAGPLAGHQLGFHKADSNGKSVYRVRVGSLSKADASSLCEKLQAGGGTCFVAKN